MPDQRKRIRFCAVVFSVVSALTGTVSEASADDLADEAELLFRLAGEHYKRGEYAEALKDYLASNRLVQNRNVVFNIARTYEQLREYPEAYRYYVQSLFGESDPESRRRIEVALKELQPRIAVIDIETEPPGATLFVERRDLGPRGQSPRALGLTPGEYRILADLPGYRPAETRVGPLRAGQRERVQLKLEPLLGTLRIVSAAVPLRVRLEFPDEPKSCVTPCELRVPPGNHAVVFEREGWKDGRTIAEVKANRTTELTPQLERLMGTLVVRTDEPGALVESDGKSIGFTPLIHRLPLGPHQVRVSSPGFRTIEQTIEARQEGEARLDLRLVQTEEVIAASRMAQSVNEAPASVTLLPRRELQALAYPTLADAIRGVRGVFIWNDRVYATAGIRGPGLMGSYGNRLLVLSDGIPLNDNWVGSSYLGYDGRADMGDVDRIEVVRGPGSVLYGTNAIAGVVNVVSRSANVRPGAEVGIGTEGDGVARARGRVTVKFRKDSGAWISMAGARGQGADLYFPEFVDLARAGEDGWVRGLDGFQARTLQGRAWYKWLSLQWFANSHDKQLATAPFGTLFRDTRTRQRDQRELVELRAEPQISHSVKLLTRVHLNQYRFLGVYPREPGADGGVQTDTYKGVWAGVEERLVYEPSRQFRLTVGGEAQLHAVVEQKMQDEVSSPVASSKPFRVGAVYALCDFVATQKVRVSAGTRLDAYSTFGTSVNPRLAVIWQAYRTGVLKLIGGRAFRAPSPYELYYSDGGVTQIASPNLSPETVYSTEVEHTHELSPSVALVGAAFASYMRSLIVMVGEGNQGNPMHYTNSAAPLMTGGVEVAIRRDWRQGWTASASYGYQHSEYLQDESVSSILTLKTSPLYRQVANQPEHILSLKGVAPIIGRTLLLGSRLTVEGPRWDRYQLTDDTEEHRQTESALLWDVVLSGEQPRLGVKWAVGMYNAFDWRYSSPAAREFRQRMISQPGRTLLASLNIAF